MLRDVKKIWTSVAYALKGLCHAYRADKSFRMELQYGLPAYLLLGWYLAPFQAWELPLYIFSYLLILIVELMNTAFETMIDHLHPHAHEVVGRSKDIAAAAVLVAFIFAALVVAVLVYARYIPGTNAMVDHLFV